MKTIGRLTPHPTPAPHAQARTTTYGALPPAVPAVRPRLFGAARAALAAAASERSAKVGLAGVTVIAGAAALSAVAPNLGPEGALAVAAWGLWCAHGLTRKD